MNGKYKTIFSETDVLKYVKAVLNTHTLITEYRYSKSYDFEKTYFMVPKQFYFIVMGEPDWEDKICKFGFLTKNNELLYESEERIYYRKIEKLCFESENCLKYNDKTCAIKPSDLHAIKWTDLYEKQITENVNAVINSVQCKNCIINKIYNSKNK